MSAGKGLLSMNSQQDPEAPEKKTRSLNPLSFYTTCVSGLGLGLLLWSFIWSFTRLASAELEVLLIFVGLMFVAELTTSEVIAPEMSFSMSVAVGFASLLLLGPLPAVPVGAVGGLSTTLVREIVDRRQGRPRAPLLQRCPFNMAVFGLPLAIAGGVYVLLGGKVGEVALLSNLLPMILAAVVIEFVNSALVVGVVSLQVGRPAFHVWRQNVSWAVPMNILNMVVGGGGLALGYRIAEILGLIVFFLPLALTIYAFRLYVGQTKAQMERLEEIIAERTEDLKKANEELKRADRVKTNFFSVINHEMRSPLTAIIGYTELLLADTLMPLRQESMLRNVKESGQRLLDLVNNLLDISRIEDGKLNIVPQAIRVVEAVKRALSVVNPLAEQKVISIDVDVPETIPNICGDPRRVDQILINLLANAVKYTPETGSVVIAAQANESTNMVEISVTDNGIGIPADLLPYVFDRYRRAEEVEARHIIGSGLGLSIAKALVNAHGGEIWVESEEGYGSTFIFALPTDVQFAEEHSMPTGESTGSPPTEGG